ncbi:right-handed parallel beta-helix repeat-containing protein [Microbacterium halophytorum]|uniref:hypothetical protein n=1 Tax=Microbacterium halophytorum TaxID=2067568 RepID=UPI000CFB0866|nr:hypothetical protein [Microbacterium halophytorum]
MSERRRRLLGAATATVTIAALAGFAGAPAQADDGRNYYVSGAGDPACSDAGPGTDPDLPWCGFGPVAGLELGPGDSLLLARGAAFDEQLVVNAPRGAEGDPARIGSYGEGAAPTFVDNGSNAAVVVKNADHTVISDLDIGGTDPGHGRGVFHYGMRLDYSSTGHEGLTVENVSVSDSRVAGMFIRNTGELTLADTAVSGVTLRDIDTSHNAHGIVFANQGKVTDASGGGTLETTANRVFRDVLVEGLRQKDDDNNNPHPDDVPSQIDSGCPDSLAISSASDVMVRDSTFDGSAGCRTDYGTAALYLGSVRDVVVANNVFVNTPNTQNPDMVAIDHEARTHNVRIAGNYFADNYGGGIEYLAIHGANDYSTDNEIRANTFLRNGYHSYIPYPGGGSVSQVGSGPAPEAVIADNFAFEPNGFLTAHIGGTTAGLTNERNLQLEQDWISHSSVDLGADDSAWSHQRRVAGSWRSLANGAGAASGAATPFELTAGSEADVALGWTAPRDGVISVRGYPIAAEGTASVSVTIDGRAVADATVDELGSVLTADDIAVAEGDVVRFEVAAGSPEVSWTPAIAYLGGPSEDGQGQWRFSEAGNAQGWTASADAEVRAGTLTAPVTEDGLALTSPDDLGLAPADVVRLQLWNASDAVSGTVRLRDAGGEFDEAHSVAFQVNAHEVRGLAQGFTDVVVPIDGIDLDRIDQVRVELAPGQGTLTVGSIEVADTAGPRWDFTDSGEGWTMNPDVSCPSRGVPAEDTVVDVDNSTGAFRQVADINWNFERRQTLRVTTGTLAQLDLWAYKTGDPGGCLRVSISDPEGDELFVGGVPADEVTASGGFVSVYPGLSGLDPDALYSVDISNPYTTPGSGSYGVGYNDQGLYPEGGEYYSVTAGGRWHGPEASSKRSLRLRTFSAPEVSQVPADDGYEPVTVSRGSVSGTTGYEPTLLSPAGLGVDADTVDTVHIRMSNPDNRQTAYVLFATADDPEFDRPRSGTPPGNEPGRRGVVIPLVPGADFHDYEIDMSAIPGWSGTIDRIMIQPSYRWNYRIGPMSNRWHGAIGWVYLDEGSEADATSAPGAGGEE